MFYLLWNTPELGFFWEGEEFEVPAMKKTKCCEAGFNPALQGLIHSPLKLSKKMLTHFSGLWIRS